MSKFDVSMFLAEFFDEARGRLQSINQKLVLLEAAELDDAGLIQLRRDLHTIKGAAQMLGVQDISELCHVFEDAVNAATLEEKTDSLPMLQFLFDLHDTLQSRLKQTDTETRIDSALKKTQFEQLKKALDAKTQSLRIDSGQTHNSEQIKNAEQTNNSDQGKKPLRRKKKTKVPKNLIAAVMGNFENSLQQSHAASQGKHSDKMDKADETENEQPQTAVNAIDFRPDLAELELADKAGNKGSANFLRVDRSRLTHLSNQIVELASLRFRDDAPEQQLQSAVKDFRQLKDKLLSDSDIAPSTLAALQTLMDEHLRQIQQCSDAFRHQQQRSSQMLNGVRDQTLNLMLKPLNSVFSMFPRAVRDACKRSGKKVQLLVAGDAVEMDQLAAESLSEPLMHLINNAIAHGIERPKQRVQSGKPTEGQITICAKQQGNLIHLDVIDDGMGMDVNEIRDQAIVQSIVSASEAEDMDDSEILELIFRPGFSTQSVVTKLAGRGMGMSVVLDVMHELTGNIHIQTEPGKGTCFSMVFPVSLTVQMAKLFRIGEQRFAMLANLIVQVMPLKSQQIKIGSGPYRKGYIMYDGHRVPVIDLHESLAGQRFDHHSEHAKILIVEHLEGFLAMLVDEVLAKTEIMLREIDPYLKYYHPIGLMGCTIIDDGSVQLLLEPNGLKEMWRTAPDAAVLKPPVDTGQPASLHPVSPHSDADSPVFHQHILLVDDSSIALNIEKQMFEQMGFRVDTAIGGSDALEKIPLNDYDLMVTDLEMPDIDGIALIQQLQHEKQDKTFPIIIIASRESATECQRALDAGADAYLAKGQLKADKTELLELLSDLLND
ncbi:MAG: response regulator [Mariprofundus sp.]|nr:response regulator [Mariprofundus sp.]